MQNFLVKWVVHIAALYIVIHMVAGVSADSWGAIVVAAFVLGLLNAFIKPFIILVTLPITIFTLGLFTLVINALLFMLASRFVKGFEVINFSSAFWAALLFSIVSAVLNFILIPKNIRRYPRDSGRGNFIDVEGKVEK